ncbi:MAG: fumarylacetoacetate hydrolase family protein [Chloroflexi bacterium]|nr:fumarylacetoacetate hydrolase family protein [Chloroflexota bacterium]
MDQETFLIGYVHNGAVRPAYQRGTVTYALDEALIPSFDWMMANLKAQDLLARLDDSIRDPLPAGARLTLRGLLNHQPVWAAGVTYKISEEARERESKSSTVYTRVYSAKRPELFAKAVGYEVVSSDDFVGIRADATWSVPEPELTVVFNAYHEMVGFTLGNDMSSRDIEGENPLYLPQAKVYDDSCSIGPRILLRPNAERWLDAAVHIRIERQGSVVFQGETRTDRLNRSLPELADYLGRCKKFPYGVLLMTGTGVVPSDDFTLAAGDVIRIRLDPIGELVNMVHVVGNSG